jgi:hypothetical protein
VNWFGPHLNRIHLSAEEAASAERLRRHVDMLAEIIGERHWWKYEILMAAEKYVRDQLATTGLPVTDQPYDVMGKTVRNLIAQQRGVRRPEEIVVVGAHYDSISGTPGADDNASAVAGLLEIAHQLSKRKFQRTIRYVSFVNEEPPFYKGQDMGSLQYAELCRQRNDNIVGMINLEMLGYYDDALGSQQYPPLRKWEKHLPTRANFIVICSDMASWRLLAKMAWGFRRSVKFPMLPSPSPRSVAGPGMSDNWSFWECGYPAVMVTDTSFLRNGNYHAQTDRLKTLHIPAMTRVVKGTIGAVARLAGRA